MVLNPTAPNLESWLAKARASLAVKTFTPCLEIQALAAFVLGQTKEWIIAHSDVILETHQIAELDLCLSQLIAGVPLPYITGTQEFYGLKFTVTPDVLIPRPETEMLVDHAITWAGQACLPVRALDIGTGSGCISVALAKRCLHVSLIAVDRDFRALQIACKNIRDHHLQDRISLLQSDVGACMTGRFDMLLSNPPYIPTAKLACLDVARYEPRLALDGGEDGMDIIRNIFNISPDILRPGGVLLMEIESSLGDSVGKLAHQFFPDAEIKIELDYAGLPRLLIINL